MNEGGKWQTGDRKTKTWLKYPVQVMGNESPFLSDSNRTDEAPTCGQRAAAGPEDVLETPRGAGGPGDAA